MLTAVWLRKVKSEENNERCHKTVAGLSGKPDSGGRGDPASRIDGVKIDLKRIDQATRTLSAEYDTVIIEGAGGLMVPVEEEYLTIDYIRERKLPAVLVTNGKLGSINHTLLSLQAIDNAGIDLFAVIYNPYFDKDKIIAEDTRNYIRGWLENHFPGTLFMEMTKI